MLDVVNRYDRTNALRVGRVLEELNFLWYEEPLSHYDVQGYVDLSRDLDIPILCSISNADLIEVLVPEKGYEYGLKTHIRVDTDGYLSVPQGPGLGAEIDWDYIKAHTTSEM